MKLRQYGYKANEKEIHGHTLQMGELKILICQKLTEKKAESMKIRIVHCGYGEVTEYANMQEFMLCEHSNRYELLVYDIHIVHMNTTNEDILVAIITDDEEI